MDNVPAAESEEQLNEAGKQNEYEQPDVYQNTDEPAAAGNLLTLTVFSQYWADVYSPLRFL